VVKHLQTYKDSERKDGKQQIDSKIFSNKPDIPPQKPISEESVSWNKVYLLISDRNEEDK
jgi:hypothetical protein